MFNGLENTIYVRSSQPYSRIYVKLPNILIMHVVMKTNPNTQLHTSGVDVLAEINEYLLLHQNEEVFFSEYILSDFRI